MFASCSADHSICLMEIGNARPIRRLECVFCVLSLSHSPRMEDFIPLSIHFVSLDISFHLSFLTSFGCLSTRSGTDSENHTQRPHQRGEPDQVQRLGDAPRVVRGRHDRPGVAGPRRQRQLEFHADGSDVERRTRDGRNRGGADWAQALCYVGGVVSRRGPASGYERDYRDVSSCALTINQVERRTD